MRKKLFLLLLPFAFIFASCSDDGHSLDKFVVNIATVENPDNSQYFYLKLDNGKRLWIAATNLNNYKPKTGQRIVANYTLLSDMPENSAYNHDIKLNDVYNVLTKGIFNITPETQDSIGHDPIGINDIWIGSDFLNIEFYYRGYNKTHYVTLAKDDLKQQKDNEIHLEFRHNARNDDERYLAKGIVSFNLTSLKQSIADSLSLLIHVKKYDDNDATYELKYKFNDKNPKGKIFNTIFSDEGSNVK